MSILDLRHGKRNCPKNWKQERDNSLKFLSCSKLPQAVTRAAILIRVQHVLPAPDNSPIPPLPEIYQSQHTPSLPRLASQNMYTGCRYRFQAHARIQTQLRTKANLQHRSIYRTYSMHNPPPQPPRQKCSKRRDPRPAKPGRNGRRLALCPTHSPHPRHISNQMASYPSTRSNFHLRTNPPQMGFMGLLGSSNITLRLR